MSHKTDRLPKGWIQARVDQVGSVQTGLQKTSARRSGRWRTKYLRSANITRNGLDLTDVFEMDITPAERQQYSLQRGDILLVEGSGSASQVGRAAIWREEIADCCYQNHIIRFRPHAAVPEYALIVFRYYAATGIFAHTSRGIGIQHLGSRRLAQMLFPLPPLLEQVQIATEAGRRLDEVREAELSLRSALRHIEAQNREILAAAVTGALVPQEASLASKYSGTFEDAGTILKIRPKSRSSQLSMLESDDKAVNGTPAEELADLPTGWTWARISEVGEIRLGRQVSPRHRQGPHPRKYLRVANVLEDRIDVSDIKEMNFSPEEFETYRLEPGDILLNEGQSLELVGRPAMFRGEVQDVCFQNHLIRFRAAPGVSPQYALLVFRHYLHSGEFKKIARGSTNIVNLGLSRFAAMPFPLPPPVEQVRISEEAHRRLAASRSQEEAVHTALGRLEHMEREVLMAAISGLLVSQNEDNEPAEMLLQRLGTPPTTSMNQVKKSTPKEATMSTKRKKKVPETTRPLLAVLLEVGQPMPLPELFAAAGYDRDSTEEVEHFYLALRTELNKTIRAVGDSGENAMLEVIHASR